MNRNLLLLFTVFIAIGAVSCDTVVMKDKELFRKTFSYCRKVNNSNPDTNIIAQNDYVLAIGLFNKNHIEYANYQVYRLQVDDLGYYHVRCYQYFNNLKIFTNDLIFHFNKNDSYTSLSGHVIKEFELDSSVTMNQDDVIQIFIDNFNKDEWNASRQLKIDTLSTCFELEYGYYDLNAGHSYAINDFTKAWKINREKYSYPYAFINDLTSNLIYYDDGIRF
jgi:Zn-dependent metalloprotease